MNRISRRRTEAFRVQLILGRGVIMRIVPRCHPFSRCVVLLILIVPDALGAYAALATPRPAMSRWCLGEARAFPSHRWDKRISPWDGLIGETCTGIGSFCNKRPSRDRRKSAKYRSTSWRTSPRPSIRIIKQKPSWRLLR